MRCSWPPGYAPMYRERPLNDPALAAARQAVELILKSHEPYPALAVDRHWNLLAGNAMLPHLMAGADPRTAARAGQRAAPEPAPQGPGAAGSSTWASGATTCSSACASRSTPPATACWRRCWKSCVPIPVPEGAGRHAPGRRVAGRRRCPSSSSTQFGVLNFISTTTVFGTPVDVTLQELALETFFPADAMTGDVLRKLMSPA